MSSMVVLLNAISVLATFVAAVGIIYLALDSTIGRINAVNNLVIASKIPAKVFLFLGIGVYLILKYFTFYLPFGS